MKFPAYPFIVACVLAAGGASVRATGVAAIKDQTFHRDSSARVVVYSRIIDSHGPYLRLVSGARNVDILRSQLAGCVELADHIPADLLEEKDLASIRGKLATLENFTARYPRSGTVLDQQVSALAGSVRRFEGGEVRFEGRWISRDELAGIRESRRLQSEALELAEVEKLVFETSQRDNGLELSDGKWATRREIEQRSPDSPTQLSEAIGPLWNGNFEGARFAVRNLDELASTQTGAPKVRTQRVESAVRNVFIAEARLRDRIIASAVEVQQAAVHDENAKKWLKPNVFGRINKDAARESREKAMEVRQRSAGELASRRQELLDQLRETDIVIDDFLKLREGRVGDILTEMARKVASRHFTKSEYQPGATVR